MLSNFLKKKTLLNCYVINIYYIINSAHTVLINYNMSTLGVGFFTWKYCVWQNMDRKKINV